MATVNPLVHSEKLNLKNIKAINFFSFVFGFIQAIGAYVISSYFSETAGSENIGAYFLIAYAVIFFLFFYLHRPVKRFGRFGTFVFFLFLQTIILAGLAILPINFFGATFLVAYIIILNLTAVAGDILLEYYSVDRLSGRIRGFNLTVLNIGFILGPFLSTQILARHSYQGIFLFQAIFSAAILAIFYFSFSGRESKYNYDVSVAKLFSRALGRADIRRISAIAFILNFFYAVMTIFSPLYLRNLGFGWTDIGLIFTIMLLPFVFLQYPLGIMADKKIGERELIIAALLIMAPAVAWFAALDSRNLYYWAMVLLLTRVGAAALEVLCDSYFYKRIDRDDVELIDFYRSSRPLGYIAAAVFSAAVLPFFSMKAVFVGLAIVILAGLHPAIKLADNKGENEIVLKSNKVRQKKNKTARALSGK